MAHSQNGWLASANPADFGGLDNSYIPGTTVKVGPGVRKGDVATVLFYVAGQFNAHVEKVRSGVCGGYNFRKIEGSASTSNHGSGTAIDLNWDKHPLGAHGTFTAAQVAAIHKIIAFCDGVVRWGGDYNGRKDEMHFEIVKDAAAVAALAKKIRGGSVPTYETDVVSIQFPVTLPIIGQGADDSKRQGPNYVKRLQKLYGCEPDGVWGPKTTAALGFDRMTEQHWRDVYGLAK